jgi:DNA modification methylase
VKLIVTSPPYLNAYDYHKYHRQRLHLIRGDIEFARKREIGSHDEFTKKNATPDKYFEDMTSCLREWERVLVSNGRCLVLIGDAIVSKTPVRVADTLVDIAQEIGLRLDERWIRTVKGTRRSFNVKNSRMTHEHGLVFVKK